MLATCVTFWEQTFGEELHKAYISQERRGDSQLANTWNAMRAYNTIWGFGTLLGGVAQQYGGLPGGKFPVFLNGQCVFTEKISSSPGNISPFGSSGWVGLRLTQESLLHLDMFVAHEARVSTILSCQFKPGRLGSRQVFLQANHIGKTPIIYEQRHFLHATVCGGLQGSLLSGKLVRWHVVKGIWQTSRRSEDGQCGYSFSPDGPL